MPELPPLHRPLTPPAYPGSTPTADPRIPGVTPHGDDSQPANSRPQLGLLIGAMVAIVVLASLAAWLVFKPSGSDTSARESAAALGITVSEEWQVDAVDGGFTIRLPLDGNAEPMDSGYAFHIAEATSLTAPADVSTWDPKISGANAYADGEPPYQIRIDAGEHKWIVTPRTWTMYQDDSQARAAWYDVASAISFTSGT